MTIYRRFRWREDGAVHKIISFGNKLVYSTKYLQRNMDVARVPGKNQVKLSTFFETTLPCVPLDRHFFELLMKQAQPSQFWILEVQRSRW
jgi:hypothetical protein